MLTFFSPSPSLCFISGFSLELSLLFSDCRLTCCFKKYYRDLVCFLLIFPLRQHLAELQPTITTRILKLIIEIQNNSSIITRFPVELLLLVYPSPSHTPPLPIFVFETVQMESYSYVTFGIGFCTKPNFLESHQRCVCILMVYSFLLLNGIPQYGCNHFISKDIQVVSSFWLLLIKLLLTFT